MTSSEEGRREKTKSVLSTVLTKYLQDIGHRVKNGNGDKTLIKYIIQGIHDEGTNKSILYGARNIYELK